MQQKLICFDLDGTLTPASTWEVLNAGLGITPEQDMHLFTQYKEGALTYEQWIPELIRIYKDNGVITKQELRSLADEIALREDAQEAIRAAKEKGYFTLLISGAVDVMAQPIAEKLAFDAWITCSKAQFNEQDELTDIISMGDEGPAKLKILSQFCEEKSLSLEDVISVGDGGNEKDIFEKTKGILLGEDKTLEPLAWKKVSSLSEISEIL